MLKARHFRQALCAVLVLSLCTLVLPARTEAASKAATNKKADAVFAEVLETLTEDSSLAPRYILRDITGDGIHEALIEYRPLSLTGSAFAFQVYAYNNGAADLILDTTVSGLYKCIFYKSAGSLLLYARGHGGESYTYYKLKKSGTYTPKAYRARKSVSGGSSENGPWYYYKLTTSGQTIITQKKFNKIVASLQTGKKSSSKAWKDYK